MGAEAQQRSLVQRLESSVAALHLARTVYLGWCLPDALRAELRQDLEDGGEAGLMRELARHVRAHRHREQIVQSVLHRLVGLRHTPPDEVRETFEYICHFLVAWGHGRQSGAGGGPAAP